MSKNNENILTKYGYKNTKARKAMLEVMEEALCPMSAEDIFLKIKDNKCSVNLSTIYRNLGMLINSGLIAKIVMDDGKALYQLKDNKHRHHLICTSCNKTIPIDNCPLYNFEKDLSEKTNFDITDHRLELYGLCPKCKK